MSQIKKILCAVDFSEATNRVAEWAAYLGKCMGAEIVVLYAVPNMSRYSNFDVSSGYIANFEREIMHGAESNMKDCLKTNLKGIKAQGIVVMGDPAEKIMETAEEQGVDVIVLGTHGRKGLDRIVFGSVADHVVKSASVPVLTIRPYDMD